MGTDFCFFFFNLGVCKDLVSSDFLSSLDMLSLAFSTSSEASVFCFFLAGLASSWKTSVAPFFISFFSFLFCCFSFVVSSFLGSDLFSSATSFFFFNTFLSLYFLSLMDLSVLVFFLMGPLLLLFFC